MESIIKDSVIDHLDKNNLIKQSQHGFTKNKSCATNLLEFLETQQGWEGLRTKKQYINSTPKNSGSTVKTVQTVHIKL